MARQGRSGPGLDRLSRRQQEVLRFAAAGMSNAEIAERLGISLDGAKWHFREIFARLGVDSREAAIELWRTQGASRRYGYVPVPLLTFAVATTVVAGAALGAVVIALSLSRSDGSNPDTSALELAAQAPSATSTTTEAPARPSATVVGGFFATATAAANGWIAASTRGDVIEPDASLPVPGECTSNLVNAVVNQFFAAWNRGDAEAMFRLIDNNGSVWFDAGYDPLTYATTGTISLLEVRTLADVQATIDRYAGHHWTLVGTPSGDTSPFPEGDRITADFVWRLTGPQITAAGHTAVMGQGKLAIFCSNGVLHGVLGAPTVH